ncbi:heparinase II/III family protein, partial [Polaribacter sp.]|nr:heparinase II/III family protein [Polaribacter sp.]
YCSEGLGYWGYGFGHYLYLAQILYDYTNGSINLFEFDNPQKLKNVGNFPESFEIQNGTCSPFADGVSSTSSKGSNFANVLSAKHFGALQPSEIRMEEAAEQLIAWQNPEMFKTVKKEVKKDLANHTYFDDFGMVISRGKQNVPLSIAMKAGHNNENHNHMDVGTYTIVLGKDIMTGDIGAPSYTAGAFSDNNPARSSWGHPVPRINNTLQSKGKEYKGKITSTEFTTDFDKVVMDIAPAYKITALKSLVRTFKNDKTNQGTITITDEFSLSEPLEFGIAIMTLSDYEIINSNTIILKTKHQTLKAEVFSDNGELIIKDELVPVKHLREHGPAYRIGVDFKEPIAKGSLTVRYTPILN